MGGVEGGSRFAGTKRFALRGADKCCLKAKDDVDNVGAGRAAKGENHFAPATKKAYHQVCLFSRFVGKG